MRIERVVWPFFVPLWAAFAMVDSQRAPKMESTIPLIDLERSEGEERIQTVAQQIRSACQQIGFFAIVNHGVNITSIQNAWEASRDFFDLSLEEKQRSLSENTTEYPYGYEHSENLAIGYNNDNGVSLPDLKETFAIGPRHPESGMPARRYPDLPINFESVLETYYEEMEKLAARLLRIFAIALELPPHWFENKFDRHQSALRLLNYPLLSNRPAPGQLRAGEHTDYGALTILKSGGPGLQVRRKGKWVDVPYMEDAFIINIGDLMQRWTNGM
jgi:isopenicillin N synthase-like dioxygenase